MVLLATGPEFQVPIPYQFKCERYPTLDYIKAKNYYNLPKYQALLVWVKAAIQTIQAIQETAYRHKLCYMLEPETKSGL